MPPEYGGLKFIFHLQADKACFNCENIPIPIQTLAAVEAAMKTKALLLLYTNCNDALKAGHTESGLLTIHTAIGKRKVFCEQKEADGGWTVIQQRNSGKIPFWNATWEEYKQGFGPVAEDSEYYIGNELIHRLSSQYSGALTLRVELHGDRAPKTRYPDHFWYGHYNFSLSDETKFYTARFWVDWMNPVGNASTGWYDITYGDGVPFSTIDRIHDPLKWCEERYHMGGWWTHYCGLSSLNGEYIPSRYANGYGMFFTIMGRYIINPKTSRMLIRDQRFG